MARYTQQTGSAWCRSRTYQRACWVMTIRTLMPRSRDGSRVTCSPPSKRLRMRATGHRSLTWRLHRRRARRQGRHRRRGMGPGATGRRLLGGRRRPGSWRRTCPLRLRVAHPRPPAAGGGAEGGEAAEAVASPRATRDALSLGVKGLVDFDLGIPHEGPPRGVERRIKRSFSANDEARVTNPLTHDVKRRL